MTCNCSGSKRAIATSLTAVVPSLTSGLPSSRAFIALPPLAPWIDRILGDRAAVILVKAVTDSVDPVDRDLEMGEQGSQDWAAVQPPLPTALLLGVATGTALVALQLGQTALSTLVELGEMSEEMLRGDRLPILKTSEDQ
ncbi:MAG: hypothetical protein VKJ85_11460 [Prochlorothrix sp.]|nr:hypothetical protein [Prochlorothrix sp.]